MMIKCVSRCATSFLVSHLILDFLNDTNNNIQQYKYNTINTSLRKMRIPGIFSIIYIDVIQFTKE